MYPQMWQKDKVGELSSIKIIPHHPIGQSRTVGGDFHTEVVVLRLQHQPTHLRQLHVQLAGSEEELPAQLGLGPVVQQHQQAALSALPLQLGGTRSCTREDKESPGNIWMKLMFRFKEKSLISINVET